jgi:predicted permease
MLADLRFAFRALRRHRGFAAAVAAMLALGIGANTAIFSVVNAVLLRGLPYPAPERLIMAFTTYPDFGHSSTSLDDFRDWRDGARGTVELAAFGSANYNVTGDGAPERAQGAAVTANYFRVLGATPTLGRAFLPEEERGSVPRVVMLGHDFWRRRFGGDPGVVGRTLTLNGLPRTVVGVAPATVILPRGADLFVPQRTDTTFGRRSEFLTVVGRVAPGATIEGARGVLATVAARLTAQYPETNSSRLTVDVTPMRDEVVGAARPALLVLAGAVGLVLLVACANVANLLLVRATTREREVATRAALGASRLRVARQLLAESVVLAAAGGAAGVLLAAVAVRLVRALGADVLPRAAEVSLDPAALAFAVVVSVGTGVLFGLAPALRLARSDLQSLLRGGGRGVAGGGAAQRARGVLVGAEVALSVLLLVGAGLLLRSFVALQRSEPGFVAEGVLTARVVLPQSAYADVDRDVAPFQRTLLDRLRAVPGVRAAALASTLPLSGAGYVTFTIQGRESQPGEDVQPFDVSDDYFRAMGVRLVRGRTFTPQDGPGAPRVAVVNEEAARRFWPGRDPIGARIAVGDTTQYQTVVGVVANVRQEGMTAKPYPQLYGAIRQDPTRGVAVVVRTAGDPAQLTSAVRRAVAALDPTLPVYDVATMTQRVSRDVARPRTTAAVVTGFGAVAQRTRELGVRMALGASRGDVRRLVVRLGMTPVVAGLAVGLIAAPAAARGLGALLYGVAPVDPLAYGGAAAFLALVALAATWLPAERATRVAPMVALRQE